MMDLLFGSFALEPQPYPALPRWCGEFHQLEAELFSTDRHTPAHRAARYADAFARPGLRTPRTPTPLPDAPSVRVSLREV